MEPEELGPVFLRRMCRQPVASSGGKRSHEPTLLKRRRSSICMVFASVMVMCVWTMRNIFHVTTQNHKLTKKVTSQKNSSEMARNGFFLLPYTRGNILNRRQVLNFSHFLPNQQNTGPKKYVCEYMRVQRAFV